MDFRNIYSLFRAQAAKYRDLPVFFTREDGGWKSQNWREFEEQVHEFACALLTNGLTRGASVAILAGSVPEWTIVDIATIAAGGVSVGIYPTSSPEQCEFIIDHSDAEFVFVDTPEQLNKIAGVSGRLPKVRMIVTSGNPDERLIELGDAERGGVHFIPVVSWGEFLRTGRQNREAYLPIIERTGREAKVEDTAIMVYTSGTTGKPKGAMLSHQYILNSVESLRRSVPIFDSDVCLSYLPGCHVAERISGIYNRLYNGTSAHFVDDLSRLYEYMLDVMPTVFASLPRFFEKIRAKLLADRWTGEIDPQVVKDAFGGRIRLLTSGGAPLSQEVGDFFARAGVPILQAYGLTENICVAFNRADDFKFGTVGKPMPMCEVRIDEDGEILVKSPMMFSGYYKEPEKTAEMFNDEGWLKTGDLGEVDEDCFLKITGRKKEIIVLSSGKNVAPALVENYVKASHLISQCFVYGDGRSYCVGLITLNAPEVMSFASANGIEYSELAELVSHPEVEQKVNAAVDAANARVSSSEQIKKYVILDRDFSAEMDEITPTLKLKRDVVARNFSAVLEKLYE